MCLFGECGVRHDGALSTCVERSRQSIETFLGNISQLFYFFLQKLQNHHCSFPKSNQTTMSGYSGYGGYAPAGGYGGSANTNAAGSGGNVRARRAPPPPPGRRPGGGGAAAAAASGPPSKPNYTGAPSAAQTRTQQTQPQQQQGGSSHDWFSSTATTGNAGGGYGGMASTGAAPAPAPAPAASSYYGTSAPAPAAPAASSSSSSDPFGYSSGGTAQMAGGIGGTSMNMQQNQGQHQAAGSTNNSKLPYSVPAWDPNLSGPMGGGAGGSSSANGASNAIGGPSDGTGGGTGYSPVDYDNEPPLLEELGINMGHIGTKSRAVVLPFSRYASSQLDKSVMEDSDLAGPLVFALALGGEMLLSGKVSFGYIYGFGLFGCFALALVLNLMSPTDAISVWTVTSILGYALLPVNALAGINVLLRINRLGVVGVLLAAMVIIWCTVASTRLFENGCGLRDQRYLVGYPIALIYSAFVIITIF